MNGVHNLTAAMGRDVWRFRQSGVIPDAVQTPFLDDEGKVRLRGSVDTSARNDLARDASK